MQFLLLQLSMRLSYEDYKKIFDDAAVCVGASDETFGYIEKYRKETKFNPIIDSLRDMWTSDEIKSTISLLHLIKTNKNKDIYLDSLEIILNAKEKFIHDYIHKISTEY